MEEIFSAIATYAAAYKLLEEIQRRKGSPLPIGDQKTGVIGEFYGRLYAAIHFQAAELVYGHPSEKAWDITVRRPALEDHKIQVKTVSAHSSTSRVSKIHPGWQELYLLRLDAEFFPVGFWVLLASNVEWSTTVLSGATMPRRERFDSCSAVFRRSEDKLDDLLEVLKQCRANKFMHATREDARA